MFDQGKLLKRLGYGIGTPIEDVDRTAALMDPRAMATEAFVGRCCWMPDRSDPEIREADPDKVARYLALSMPEAEKLIEDHQRIELANNGAQWGKCHPDEHDGYAVKYFVDRGTFPAHYTRSVEDAELQQLVASAVWGSLEQLRDLYLGKPQLDVMCQLCEIAIARVGMKLIEVFDGADGREHNIHLSATPQPGSQIGVAQLPIPNSCGQHLYNRLDSTYFPKLIAGCQLLLHELLHNLGELHKFVGQDVHHGVMSYRPPTGRFYGLSTGRWPHILPRDPSLDSLLGKYGPPLPEVEEPEPTPAPTAPPVPTGQPRLEAIDGYVRAHGPIPAGEYVDWGFFERTRV